MPDTSRAKQKTHTEEPVELDTKAEQSRRPPMELKGRDDNQGGDEEHI